MLEILKAQLPSHICLGWGNSLLNVKLEDAPKEGDELKPPTV